MGLCPFHGEKSPSFAVSPSRQTYHCFGCGVHGNAIGFLMEHLGMGFVDAVSDLSQAVGLAVPRDERSPEERERFAKLKEHQGTLSDVLKKASDHYRKQLKSSARAIDYLKRRGLSGEIAARFAMGYAPEGWRALASAFAHYDDPLLEESGLVISQPADQEGSSDVKRYDRFRDRIMFPIRSVQGEVIGFGGRVLDRGEPKYLNSPETPVFSKGRELYGLFEARSAIRQSGFVLVVEGYMDVVALAQLGFPNAVATLGTACTAEHVQKLFRFTDSVVFSFDGDNAGRRAARKALDAALPFATDVRTVKFLFLPSEHDPDSYIREHGQEGFADCVKKAVPLSRFMLEAAADGCDLDTAEGRAHMASNARPLWSLLPEGALRPQLLAEIADKVMIDSRDLLQLWQPAKASGKNYQKKSTNSGSQQNDSYRANPSRSSPSGSGVPDFPDYPDFSDSADGSYYPQDLGDSAHGGPPLDDYPPASYDPGSYSPPTSAKPAWTPGRSGSKKSPSGAWTSSPVRRVAGRMLPASREDRVLRLLLTQPDSWDRLSAAEHHVLLALPAPHGPLFVWLESQIHEHGPQPWAALREGLRGHANERHAVLQISQMMDGVQPDWNEAHSILKQLLTLQRDAEITALAARAHEDPAAMGRLRELMAQTPKKAAG